VITEEIARRLCAMLKNVVDSGTGKNAGIANIAVAGKTGTAQKLEGGVYSKTKSWASFIGFLPVAHPALLCGVVIDEPAANLMGATAAAPAFRKIAMQIISHPSLEYAEKVLNNRMSSTREMVAAGPDRDRIRPAGPAGRAAQDDMAVAIDEGDMRFIPDCRGRDARDAINLINLRGLVPFVIGAGTVQQQRPPAGSLTTTAHACTLMCDLGGYHAAEN
jgi:cell division protein FtsI (penicillin-binding protein 3)